MKKITLTLIGLTIGLNLHAQQVLWSFNLITNGGGVSHLATDSSGNVYFSGILFPSSTTTYFPGSNGNVSFTNLRTFVVKYNPLGEIKYVSGGFGAAYQSSSGGFSLDKYGNAFLTGSFGGTCYFGNNSDTIQRTSNSEDIFLVGLDSNGKAVFFDVQGDSCSDAGLFVTSCPSDELIHIGYETTSCVGDPDDYTYSSFFRKLDSARNIIWTLTPNTNLFSQKIIPTKDYGFVINGNYHSGSTTFNGLTTSITLPSPFGFSDAFLVKYSLGGEVLWVNTVSGDYIDFNRGLTVDGNNDIIFAVESNDTSYYANVMLLPNGVRTVHLLKLDASGNYLKHISFNDGYYSHFFWVTDLTSDKHGNIYVVANIDSTLIIGSDTVVDFGSNTTHAAVSAIIKFDKDFNYLWSTYISGVINGGRKIAVTDSIIYVVYGSDGSCYVSAIKNGSSTSTSINEISSANFHIYPNPSSGKFTIESTEKISSIEILNLLGEKVTQSVIPSGASLPAVGREFTIDLSQAPKGIYFVQVLSEGQSTVRKIVLN